MKSGICRLFSTAFLLVPFTAVASAQTPVERGSYLVNSIAACGNCHAREADGSLHPGMALTGGFVFDTIDPALPGHVIASNITPDPDTGIGKWTQTAIIMGLRNGKRPDGSVIGPPMPIPMYRHMSDQDATAIATYLLSLSPVRNTVQKSQYKVKLTGYGPSVAHVEAPSPADKVAYGGYLATLGHCVLCHTPPGKNTPLNMKLAFAGGREFGSISQIGIGPTVSRNITSDPDQGLGKWTDDQIKNAITKGVRADGTKLGGPMPYAWFDKMKPTDLDAIVAYLRTIKPVKNQ